jgi:hypothetical protein
MKPPREEGLLHPGSEAEEVDEAYPARHKVDTFGGLVEVEWEDEGAVGMHGGLVYFVEFLKISGLWERFVEECPLHYVSPNAPSKSEILGTILFSVLSGHRRYAHITGIRADVVLPRLLGIERFRSEDSIRRAFEKVDEEALTLWMDRQMDQTFAPLLRYGWVLDLDTTVKTLYGHQEEARVGYNPHKPGRPSHVYHAMLLTAARLVLNVDTEAGNLTASAYGMEGLWGWLDSRHRDDWPTLIRGDIAYGNQEMMLGCEARALPYLFKVRKSPGVAAMLGKLARQRDGQVDWMPAGKGWEGVSQRIQLQGWTRERRVIVLRRKLPGADSATQEDTAQPTLPGLTLEYKSGDFYEHAVLVTNWAENNLLTVAQMYRDRADAENIFDELKNQWGWRGFATQDLKRSRLMARMVALIFNWWSIYTRMGSGPVHANQTKLPLSSMHAKARVAAKLLSRISQWVARFVKPAEQLERVQRCAAMVVQTYREFGKFPLDEKPEALALEPLNCWT